MRSMKAFAVTAVLSLLLAVVFGVVISVTPAEAKGPCRCPKVYAPVECDNGKTYPNACVAACRASVQLGCLDCASRPPSGTDEPERQRACAPLPRTPQQQAMRMLIATKAAESFARVILTTKRAEGSPAEGK